MPPQSGWVRFRARFERFVRFGAGWFDQRERSEISGAMTQKISRRHLHECPPFENREGWGTLSLSGAGPAKLRLPPARCSQGGHDAAGTLSL